MACKILRHAHKADPLSKAGAGNARSPYSDYRVGYTNDAFADTGLRDRIHLIVIKYNFDMSGN